MMNLLEYSEALTALGMAACGWILATVRKKESRIRLVEDAVISIQKEVTEVNKTVTILLEHQLRK